MKMVTVKLTVSELSGLIADCERYASRNRENAETAPRNRKLFVRADIKFRHRADALRKYLPKKKGTI